MFKQKSFVLKPKETEKKWYLVDASGKGVGRLATQVADILRGKNNPKYTANTDSGDFVVLINADKVKLSGNKWDKKFYFTVSGFIGGLRKRAAKELSQNRPELILKSAVKGMLPKTSLGRKQLTKLKIYAGENHEHAAQKPIEFKV